MSENSFQDYDPGRDTYADYCFDHYSSKELEEKLNGNPETQVLQHWGITGKEWRVEIKSAIRRISRD